MTPSARPFLGMSRRLAPLAPDRAQPSHDELATAVTYADIAITQVSPDDATATPAPDQDTSPRRDIHKQIILLHIGTITYL